MALNDMIIDFYKKLLGGQMANFIVAIIILLIAFIAGRILRRVVKKLLHEIDLDKNIKKAGLKISLENIISAGVSYLIYFIAIIEVLNQFGIVTPVFTILLFGVVTFLVVVSLLAVKDFIPNFISGFYIYRTGFIRKGDTVKVRNLTGIVEEVTMTKTKLKTKTKDLVFIPNSVITKSEVTKLKK